MRIEMRNPNLRDEKFKMKRIGDGISWFNENLGKFCTVGLIMMIVVMSVEVVGRYIFNHPFIWSTELSGFLFAFTALMLGGYTLLHNDHVRVDIFYGRLSRRGKAIADIVTLPVFLGFLTMLLWSSWMATTRSIAMGEVSPSAWHPPMFPIKALVLIGAFLMFAQGMVKLGKDIAILRKKEVPEEEDKGGVPDVTL